MVGLGLELRSGLGLELGLGVVPGRPAITLSSSSAPSAPPMRLSRTCRKPLNLDSIGLVSRATWLGIGLGLGIGIVLGIGLGSGLGGGLGIGLGPMVMRARVMRARVMRARVVGL